MNTRNIREKTIEWYQDKKLIIAFVLIIVSLILGVYSKILVITKFYEPFYVITGLSLYTFSWIFLFLGVFIVGWRTVKAMQNRIHRKIRKSVKRTYHHARKFPKRATSYTRKLHKKGMDKITTTSKRISERIRR